MTMKSLVKLTLLLLSLSFVAQAQKGYQYRRPIMGIEGTWHKLELPNNIFGHLQADGTDLRIVGITQAGDTIEAPYILRLSTEKVIQQINPFRIINQSHNKEGFFFTFDIENSIPTNQIDLRFKETNFDWRLRLEGSHNQQEWFTLVDQYRILSIANSDTHFSFTEITFPTASYRYYRMLVRSEQKPELVSAEISELTEQPGQYKTYRQQSRKITNNKEKGHSEIDIALEEPVPVSQIGVRVSDQFDYYRPITITYLRDSFKTEKGWRYQYDELFTGTLTSMGKNDFSFAPVTLRHLRLNITHGNNPPVHPDSITVRGYVQELVVRIDQPAEYFLYYGNKLAGSPDYDIQRFTEKIPAELAELKLGDESFIEATPPPGITPLFRNKTWLWLIMTAVVVLLGWFALRMLRK